LSSSLRAGIAPRCGCNRSFCVLFVARMNAILVWFRRDLRLDDQPALAWALKQQVPILPVYIHSPDEEAPWAPGGASRWWLRQSLKNLEERLAKRGLQLVCLQGNALALVPPLVQQAGVAAVAANRLHEPNLVRRDRAVARILAGQGIGMRLFDASLLFSPDSLLNQQGKPYRVFTPFWRKARQLLEVSVPEPGMSLPAGPWPASVNPAAGCVDDLKLLEPQPWQEKLTRHWQPGEVAAQQRLAEFIDSGMAHYKTAREFPALQGSSRLSPHLHFGEISPQTILRALMPHLASASPDVRASVESFLSELGWREFARHLLWHFPHASQQSMNPRFRDGFWGAADAGVLRAWQQGRTGIALVDAGMRELWATGWMHNRVRMIVGSFLTKNLGIHWLSGAQWFWDTLVDADLASNSLGWQWVAGCGVDAAPYFRIFNPDTQARKFDPRQEYLQRWLNNAPRLSPIVDIAESRRLALARYRHLPP
jgi:deoxyribodipyrimidine photo-lyase